MMTNFKPMLAATLKDITELRLPCYGSPKKDGIRCELMESHQTGKRIAYSRTLKPIPNQYIRATLEHSALPLGMDGELVVGNNFQDTASGVMTFDGKPPFKYSVFDFFGDGTELPFYQRYEKLLQICCDFTHYSWLELVVHKKMYSLLDVHDYEEEQLKKGEEGIMLRSMEGVYKFGRSTPKEQGLIKLKRFTDADAKVVGFDELMHNDNTQLSDARGYAERSSHQDSMIPGDTLGALVCKHLTSGIVFRIGTGFTAAERQEIWNNRERYEHRVVTYKYQSFGVKNAPRAPVFLRWKLDSEL